MIKDKKPTFVGNTQITHIYVSLAKAKLLSNVIKWNTSEEENLRKEPTTT